MEMEEETTLRRLAIKIFNDVWNLLDKTGRSQAENDTMLHGAHASRYLWELVGQPVNLARGEWQVSRVYSVLGRAEGAHYHAQRCLDICLENAIGDFDLAYAYEALARACAIAGDADGRQQYYSLAKESGQHIKEEDDKKLFDTDMSSIP